MDTKSSTSSRSPADVEGKPVAKKTRLVHKTIIYDDINVCVQKLHILEYFTKVGW